MQEKCWSRHQTQGSQRNYLARNETSQDSGLLRTDKSPDGVTLIPWKHGKCLAWDVTMPDTFAVSHLPTTALNHGSAAESSATLKTPKYANIVQTHIFTPVAIETSVILSIQARELLTEIGKRSQEKGKKQSTSSSKCQLQYNVETCSVSRVFRYKLPTSSSKCQLQYNVETD